MKDEELIVMLRNEANADPEHGRATHLERFAAGELSAAETRALQVHAEEEGETDSLALLAPLDESWMKAAETRVNKTWSRTSVVTSIGRRAPLAMGVGVLALAAGAALFVRTAPTTDEPLPHYSLTLGGANRETRGAAEPTTTEATFGQGSVVHLVLRPDHAVPGKVAAKAAVQGAGPLHFADAAIEVSDRGAVKIDGPALRLFDGPPGDREIIVVVGRPSALPTQPDAMATLRDSKDVAVLRTHVQWLSK